MAQLSNYPSSNRLLAALSDSDREFLDPHLDIVEMPVKFECEVSDEPIEHVYFPESGIISTINGRGDDLIEVGMTGREGVTGLPILLGSDRSPNQTYVQVAGHARRINADHLRHAIEQSGSLRALLLNFVQFVLIQTRQTALANARFKIEERLARWVLMAQDRVDLPLIPLTHEFLSIMLGVRRAGVTDAIHALVGRGMIRADRGQIEVIDRAALIEWANGCYGVPEREYERLIGRDSGTIRIT